MNAKESEKNGFGISQPYAYLNEKGLYKALDKVLHNSKYLENAQKYGAMVNDQINKPVERAIWWIEHIMRHPKMYQGRSPVHSLYWFQYFLLDVLFFYVFVIYILFLIFKCILTGLWLFCRRIKKLKRE